MGKNSPDGVHGDGDEVDFVPAETGMGCQSPTENFPLPSLCGTKAVESVAGSVRTSVRNASVWTRSHKGSKQVHSALGS
jgi:hypothetical protein